MTQTRQLAAIMFTDIVGYTALMGEDEKKAFGLLRKNRELQKPLISEYNGKWVKELGDGVLASFQTVTDAVSCAMKIQQASSIKALLLLSKTSPLWEQRSIRSSRSIRFPRGSPLFQVIPILSRNLRL